MKGMCRTHRIRPNSIYIYICIYVYIHIYTYTPHIICIYHIYITCHTHIYTYTYITTHLILLLKLLLLPLTNACVWSLSTSAASILAWPNHNKNWSNYLKVCWLIPFFGPAIQWLAIYQTQEDKSPFTLKFSYYSLTD